MPWLQLAWLAIMQGVTELFPISSLGHSVIVPVVLNWPIDREAPWFLPFIVVLHLGTATGLFLYFWRDWFALIGSFLKDGGRPRSPDSRLLWLLIAGTVPAGFLGFVLEHSVRQLFAGFTVAAIFLMINGVILIVGDRLKCRQGGKKLEFISWTRAVAIGCTQALALVPGISRSGITLAGGLVAGLEYVEAARFSFLLATPVIAAAGALEIPKLFSHQTAQALPASMILLYGTLSGLFAYISTAFLMRYFERHDIQALKPFGIYCLVAGAAALAWHMR